MTSSSATHLRVRIFFFGDFDDREKNKELHLLEAQGNPQHAQLAVASEDASSPFDAKGLIYSSLSSRKRQTKSSLRLRYPSGTRNDFRHLLSGR